MNKFESCFAFEIPNPTKLFEESDEFKNLVSKFDDESMKEEARKEWFYKNYFKMAFEQTGMIFLDHVMVMFKNYPLNMYGALRSTFEISPDIKEFDEK